MKKLIFTLSFFASVFVSSNVMAQACPSGTCTPTGGPSTGGFENNSTIPCATQAVYYDHTVQFTMFSSFNFLGQQDVDSIEFISVGNLPCGICWSVNKANKRYAKDEDGCIRFTGSTNDADGQYKMAVSVKAWINGIATSQTIPASLFDQTGVRLIIRVKTANGTCVTPDTSANATNLTAGTGCPLNVNEVTADFSSVSLTPNPLNTTGVLSFIADKNAVYTVTITDITGKVTATKQIAATTGVNTTSIERNNLPAGMYFLSLSDGKNNKTNRFTITE